MRIRKGIIIELSLIIVFVALAIVMYNIDLDLIFFKFYTTKSLEDKRIQLEQKMSELQNVRVSHKDALTSLENAKSSYSTEKSKYEAISEETLTTINTATQDEEYNIEYMWVSLGNYAKENNLTILLYEPGASADGSQELSNRTNQTLRVKVQGTYLNVAEFFYQVEQDKALRFNLDNIRMEYISNNDISAIFEVKDLILNK